MHLWKIIYTPYKKHLAGQPGELLNGGPRLGSASGSVPPQTYALPLIVILQILSFVRGYRHSPCQIAYPSL